jgi:D-Tyr-tRNAtyr deacylase
MSYGRLEGRFHRLVDTRKGNRPSCTRAAPPDRADALYERFADQLAATGIEVARAFSAPVWPLNWSTTDP